MPTAPQRTLRLALYARVSTAEQTVAPQLDRLRDYAAARGFEVAREYVDQGVSGAKDRRPAVSAQRTPSPCSRTRSGRSASTSSSVLALGSSAKTCCR